MQRPQVLLIESELSFRAALSRLLSTVDVRSVRIDPDHTVDRILHGLRDYLEVQDRAVTIVLVPASIRVVEPRGTTGLARLAGLMIAQKLRERYTGALPILVFSPLRLDHTRRIADREPDCESIDLISEGGQLLPKIIELVTKPTAPHDPGESGEQVRLAGMIVANAFERFFGAAVQALELALQGDPAADSFLEELFGGAEWSQLLVACDGIRSHPMPASSNGGPLKEIAYSIRGFGGLYRIARLPASTRRQGLLRGYLAELRSIRYRLRQIEGGA